MSKFEYIIGDYVDEASNSFLFADIYYNKNIQVAYIKKKLTKGFIIELFNVKIEISDLSELSSVIEKAKEGLKENDD